MKDIYLIQESENNYFKIGVSKNISQRIKQLQTGSAGSIKVLNTFKSEFAHKIEKSLHRKYNAYNIKGEWFDLPESAIESFISDCSMYNKAFNSILNESTLYYKDEHYHRFS